MKLSILVALTCISVATSFADPITELNVTAPPFNAVGDGVADDSLPIQAALDAAAANGGGKVFIPDGIYKIGTVLVVGSKTLVAGAGKGATVLRSIAPYVQGRAVNGAGTNSIITMVASTNSSIENLTVDNHTNGNLNNGITLLPDGANYSGTPCTNCTIQNCEVLGFDAHEYLIWNLRGTNIKILNNYVDGGVLIPAGSPQEGIETYGGHDVLIQGNTVQNIGNTGINVGSAGVVANTDLFGVQISNNHIRFTNIGVHCGSSISEGDPAGYQGLSHVQIKNNIIENPSADGIRLFVGSGVTVEDVQIIGNSIAKPKFAGISVISYPNAISKGVVVSQNVIQNASGNPSFGIYVVSTDNVMANGNMITDSAFEGIRLVSSNNASLSGNVVNTAQTMAMQAVYCTGLTVRGNSFRNYNTGGPQAGLVFVSVVKSVIAENTFDSPVVSPPVFVDSASNAVSIARNDVPYPPQNHGSNPNIGRFTVAAGTTSVSIANTLVNSDCGILIIQKEGKPIANSVLPQSSQFTVTLAAPAQGNEVFRYEILK